MAADMPGLVALALVVGLVLAVAVGWVAPQRYRGIVVAHPRGALVGVLGPLAAGAAMAAAAAVVRAREGTCAQPRAIGVGTETETLCEVVAPWLVGWASALLLIGVVAGGLVLGARLRARNESHLR